MCVIYWTSCCFSNHENIRVITWVIYGREVILKYPFIFLEGLALLKTYFSSEWEWEILSKAPGGTVLSSVLKRWIVTYGCLDVSSCCCQQSSWLYFFFFFFFQWIGALIFLSLWPELSFYISLPFCVSFSLAPSFFPSLPLSVREGRLWELTASFLIQNDSCKTPERQALHQHHCKKGRGLGLNSL